jgi:hypothetical protein
MAGPEIAELHCQMAVRPVRESITLPAYPLYFGESHQEEQQVFFIGATNKRICRFIQQGHSKIALALRGSSARCSVNGFFHGQPHRHFENHSKSYLLKTFVFRYEVGATNHHSRDHKMCLLDVE